MHGPVLKAGALEATLAVGDDGGEHHDNERGASGNGNGNLWLLLFGCLQSFLNTGLVFGWPALVVVLQRDGAYSELCDNGGAGDCEAQRQKFSSLFIISQSCFSFAALPIGWFLDSVGPKRTSVAGTILVTLGLMMLAYSNSKTRDMFLPALIFVAMGGAATHLSWFHISNLFPLKKKGIAAVVVGMFTLSGVVFVIYEAASAAGVSSRALFIGHSCLNCVCIVGAAALWPRRPYSLGDRIEFMSRYSCAHRILHAAKPQKVEAEADPKQQPPHNWTTLPISKQVLLPSFLSMLLFFTLNYLAYAFFLGTALDQLERFGDDPGDRAYLKILAWIMPLMFIAVPGFAKLLDKVGFSSAFFFVNTCGVISAALSLVDSLSVQVVRFVFFALFRVCLFSAMFAYLGSNYGFQSFGRLSGGTLFVASALSLVALALKNVVKDDYDGNFFAVNLGLLIMAAVCYFHPLYVKRARI